MKNSHTHYEFTTKEGRTYRAEGQNRFDAQQKIELAWRIDLTGATWTQIYKLREGARGIVK